MINCKYCGVKLEQQSLEYCPECKTNFATGKSKLRILKPIGLTLFFGSSLLLVLYFSSEDTKHYVNSLIFYIEKALSKIFQF